jgi:hypothetical protein
MQLSKFFNSVLGDGARSNKFDVFFSIDGGMFDKRLSALCQNTSLPGLNTDVIEYKYKGKPIPIPIGCTYTQDWECTFLVDDNHDIKKFFEDWISMYDTRSEDLTYTGESYHPISIPGGGTLDKPTINVRVVQYNFDAEISPFTQNDSNVTATYMLYNVFPVSTSSIGYTSEDDMETLTVNFKFSHFRRM